MLCYVVFCVVQSILHGILARLLLAHESGVKVGGVLCFVFCVVCVSRALTCFYDICHLLASRGARFSIFWGEIAAARVVCNSLCDDYE